jgi:hypothetical protein
MADNISTKLFSAKLPAGSAAAAWNAKAARHKESFAQFDVVGPQPGVRDKQILQTQLNMKLGSRSSE